ncbi:hypothetical protein [Pseudoxanthomonas kaohsiungensis]|uniref:Uncharacterized protein n=1 Tax=Pseudoxanthomonas kaohsiungensis TaxID=283923 RepID=A0ABW3M0X0_9GAMM|nr:hypothetical protein [Pseudoxanthomonas kaohsiungensis]KAF1702884.1 hypothetical protein CSC66_08915 [Pseudoxanthomonas kaohsiungensis]
MSNVNPFYKRDPQVAEQLREEFIANEGALDARLREEMQADPGKFLAAAFGTAYNYVPFPKFDVVGPKSMLEIKSRVAIALEGLAKMTAEHHALTAGQPVLVLSSDDELLVVEALSALRKQKEDALRTAQSLPQFQRLTETDFGIQRVAALMKRVAGEPVPLKAVAIDGQAERTYSSAARDIAVELPGGAMGSWMINPGLTDRWGDVVDNLVGPEADRLRVDPHLRERLSEQLWGEMTFIAIKDGQYGVLIESEFAVVGDAHAEDQGQLVEREVMLNALRRQAVALAAEYPQIELCLIPQDEACDGRPGLWAWIGDGRLDEAQRGALGNAMLDPTPYLDEDAAPRMGLR